MSILSTSSKLVRVGNSYIAGEGISIDNNVISVTGDYGHAYYPGENISISDDNVISSKDWSSDIDTAVQNVSAETTAWVSEQGYITDASLSDYALVTDVETTSGLLKMDIDTVSGSISSKMDSTAFNDWQNGQYSNDIAGLTNKIDTVSSAVDNISATIEALDIPTHQEVIDASGYAYSQSTAWVDSQGYLKEHQDISYLATKSEVDTVSSFLSGAIDYVSANAGDEFPASANDAITAYQTYSGDYLTNQDISNLATKDEVSVYTLTTTLEQVSGDIVSQIPSIEGLATTGQVNTTSSFLSGAIDYLSGQIPVIPDMSATEWNSVYDSVESNSGLWNEMTAYQNASGTFLTAVDLSNYYTKSETSGATELANAFANIPAGDADVNAYVQNNSANIDNVNSTVQSNSSQWAQGGGNVDTIPVAVISPLVTGFSGESAYLGIESTALNLSSYVPVSAIGVNSNNCVSGISGKQISAYYSRTSLTSNYANTADRAYKDRGGNEISSYYQPKLNIAGSDGTITAINSSAIGGTMTAAFELSAGAGISITDDLDVSATVISVTAAGGNPEVEQVVQTYSAAGTWLTAHQSLEGYATTSDLETVSGDIVSLIPSTAGLASEQLVQDTSATITGMIPSTAGLALESDLQIVSGGLDYVSGALTGYQPVGSYATTGELDTASSFLSGAVDYVSGAFTGYLTTAQYETDSAVFNAKQDTLTFGYDEQDRINSINNSALAGGGDVPEGVMSESGLEYNAVNEISGYNGSAIAQYGAEKQWLTHDDTLVHLSNSAQYALGVALPNISADLARMMGIDETLLYSGSNYVSSCTLSESLTNFNYIAIETPGATTLICSERHTFKAGNGIINLNYLGGNNYPVIRSVKLSADNVDITTLSSIGITLGAWTGGSTGIRYSNNDDLKSIVSVYGIGRKN